MADVDEQLLDTAERLYYARSIQGVGMAELRDESGVPLKRIYQLHPGKEDIVAAYLQRRDARWRAELAVHVGRAKDPRKRVLAVFDWLQEQFSEPGYNGDAWTNAYGELGSTSEVVAEEVRRHKAALREYLSELVADAGGGRSTAHAIYFLFEGAMATAAIEQSPKAAKQARRPPRRCSTTDRPADSRGWVITDAATARAVMLDPATWSSDRFDGPPARARRLGRGARRRGARTCASCSC